MSTKDEAAAHGKGRLVIPGGPHSFPLRTVPDDSTVHVVVKGLHGVSELAWRLLTSLAWGESMRRAFHERQGLVGARRVLVDDRLAVRSSQAGRGASARPRVQRPGTGTEA